MVKNNKISKVLLGAGILTSALLTGCLGGGGGGSSTASGDSSVTVSPALGKFSSGARVYIRNPAKPTEELGNASTDATGKAIVNIGSYSGPMLIEVKGGTGVTYYDERDGSNKPFSDTDKLRTLAPAVQTAVGVTLATNAAVKRAESAKELASLSVSDIKDANSKIAAALGILDVLQAPTLVDSTTVTNKSLDVGTAADQYALQLAAYAKLATGTNTALDVANDLAADLADDKLDGQAGGTAISSYVATTIAADLKTQLVAAATQLADADSANIVAASPNLLGNINTDVSVINSDGTYVSDLQKAKTLFSELRTALNVFSNGSTGFLDTQAARMNTDLSANVTPEMTKVASRLSALGNAMGFFEDGKAYAAPSNTHGLSPGSNPLTSASALVRKSGDPYAVMYGYGSYDFCWTDSATGVTNKVTCAHAGSDSADWANSRVKMVVFELTGTGTNQYSYTATRYNMAVSFDPYGQIIPGAITLATGVPAGSGTVAMTASGTIMTGLTLNGTLPPSAITLNGTGVPATGVDTVAISVARTALATANNYRYALSGSVSTANLADSSKVVSLSLDSGSYFDLDETNAATTGNKIVAAKLIGTAQTVATKFTGTLDMGSFMANADGQNYAPTSVVFNGSISDTSTGGAGQILAGKLEGALASYNQYHSTQADSSSNYKHLTVTFTGTVTAPSRPVMTLVLSATKTGVTTSNVTLNYSYGTVSITGSGTMDSANSASNTLNLVNQDGIQWALASGLVTKSGTTLASISNNVVTYTDGSYESLM